MVTYQVVFVRGPGRCLITSNTKFRLSYVCPGLLLCQSAGKLFAVNHMAYWILALQAQNGRTSSSLHWWFWHPWVSTWWSPTPRRYSQYSIDFRTEAIVRSRQSLNFSTHSGFCSHCKIVFPCLNDRSDIGNTASLMGMDGVRLLVAKISISSNGHPWKVHKHLQ